MYRRIEHHPKNPLPNIDSSIVFCFVDFEGRFPLIAKGSEYIKRQPTQISKKVQVISESICKQIGVSMLDMNDVKNIAPGPKGKDWYNYIKSTRWTKTGYEEHQNPVIIWEEGPF